MSAKTRSWQGPVRDKVTCDMYFDVWIMKNSLAALLEALCARLTTAIV